MNTKRIVFAALALLLCLGAFWSFYLLTLTPFDENLFADVATRLQKADAASRLYVYRAVPGSEGNGLRAGDMILKIAGADVKSEAEVMAAVHSKQHEKSVEVHVLRASMTPDAFVQISPAALQERFCRDLPYRVVNVVDVIKGGASDRAGMKIGDLIFRINGSHFKNAVGADSILRSEQIGKTITYEVIRDNRELTLNVTLAKFGVTVPMLVFLIAGSIFLLTGLFIGMKATEIKAARLLGWGFVLLGVFLIAVISRKGAVATTFEALRNIGVNASLFTGIATLYHAALYFPSDRPELQRKRWLVPLLYSAASGLTVISFFANQIAIFAMLALLIGATVFAVMHRKTRSPEYIRLSRVTSRASLLLLVLVVASIIAGRWINGNVINSIIAGSAALIPLSYLYTIGRYGLLNMSFRVRRNVRYTVATIMWGIAVFYLLIWALFSIEVQAPGVDIVFTGASIEVVDAAQKAANRVPLERAIAMLTAILLTFGFLALRRRGQRLLDRKYFRTRFDYRKAGAELGDVMATRLGMVDLARGIVQKLTELMQLKRGGVLFFDKSADCCCQEVYGCDGTAWKAECLLSSQEIGKAVAVLEHAIRTEYLPARVREIFANIGFLFVVPIRSKDVVIGVLLVGEKQSEAALNDEDIEFLGVAARQASVAIENAFLYEDLAEQERMKHELQIARRIQLESLPQKTPHVFGLDIDGASIPALEVGGDFFDYLNGRAKKVTVIVGDVSGKGTSAALYMSKVQGIFRSLHTFELAPADLFIRANKLLCMDMEKKSFVTVIGAAFDSDLRSMTFVRAGHLPIFHYQAKERSVRTIIPKGIGIGLDAAGAFVSELEQQTLSYMADDILLFITDGITEARNAEGDDFGEERLARVLESSSAKSAKEIKNDILEAVNRFSVGSVQNDDQTIVVVKGT
ncbi:MAG: SpoIIE family protein phosphatase [Ignavibacteriales bacterium]|nr:SpoIIE family protein phosphatase [Ignavibacteriales bacterium]